MKLAVRITLIGIIIMGLVIGSMLWISISTARSGLEEKIGEGQLQLAKSTMAEIDRVMFYALQDIRAMADDEEFEGALAGTDDTFKSNEKLDELSILTGPWDELEIFDLDGYVIAAVDRNEIGEHLDESSQSEQEAFKSARAGNIYYSDLSISSETGKLTIIFAAPVRDETTPGKPIVGVVIGNFAWAVVEEIIAGLDIQQVHLYNRDGFLLASNLVEDHSNILKSQNEDLIIHHSERGNEFDLTTSNEGRLVLQSHVEQQGYLSYKGSGWALLVKTPAEVAFSSVTKATQRLLLAGLILLIVTVLGAFFIAKSISTPIIKLKQSAEKISRGNLAEKIEVKTADEVGELAETFDNMRYSLKMVIDEYEEMKGKDDLNKKVKSLEKKQAETIKKLRMAIAEQKMARVAEQKALQKYRDIAGNEAVSEAPEEVTDGKHS
jgi:methyl-accepting chemotaxis protein